MPKILKIILAVIGLLILWVATLYFRRAPIEQDLSERVKAALNRSEFSQIAVTFVGRDGKLTGEVSSWALVNEAESRAKEIWGVRCIDNQLTAPVNPIAVVAKLQGMFRDGKFVLSGLCPDPARRTNLVLLAEKAFGAGTITDQLSIDPTAKFPDFFEKGYLAFLGLKGIEEPGFSIMPDKFILTGKIPNAELKTRLGAELARALAPVPVQNELEVVPVEASKPSLENLTKFFAENPIEFAFASSNLSKQHQQILDRAFELLEQVPQANFEIEGHTDAIGSDAYNMRLSRARAISVRLYLLEKGIKPERLPVKGYGEKQPKSSNDTEDGRQRNRRVNFKLLLF